MKLSTGVSPASAERLNRACDRVCYRASESDLEKVSSPSEAPLEQFKDQLIQILKSDSWGQQSSPIPQSASTIEIDASRSPSRAQASIGSPSRDSNVSMDVGVEIIPEIAQVASDMQAQTQQVLLERQRMERTVNQKRVEEMTLEQNISVIKQMVQMREEQQSLKCELITEIKCRERLALEIKEESLKRDKLAEDMQVMARNRTGVENEIVASIRQVMEQSEAFREAVCQEAVEQRTVLAKEITSGLEATLDQRLADLRDFTSGLEATLDQRVGVLRQLVEETASILTTRCDTHEQRFEHVIQRMQPRVETAELRASFEAEHAAAAKQMAVCVEELQRNIAEARCYTDGIGERCSDVEQRAISIEKKMSEDKLQKSQDMFVAVSNLSEEVKEEAKERTLLGRRLHAESTNISALWTELENVQQQFAELRESLRLDIQSQLIQQKQASEDKLSSLISSLQTWQDKSIQSFEKHKNDVSALREQMTEHLSWVAKDHETEVAQLKTQVWNFAEQMKEVSAKLFHIQDAERNRANDTSLIPRANDASTIRQAKSPRECERNRATDNSVIPRANDNSLTRQSSTPQRERHRANDTSLIPRTSDTSLMRQSSTPQVSGVSRSSGSQPTTARLRPVSPCPMRNMPSPPLATPSNTSYAAPSNSMIVDASVHMSAVVGRNLPKPPEACSSINAGPIELRASQPGGLQRTPSAGLLSARFNVGPSRNSTYMQNTEQ